MQKIRRDMLENAIQSNIVKYLNSIGYLTVKNITVSKTGWPDLTTIKPNGDHLYIEVKQPGQKLRPSQEVRHQQLRDHNTEVITITSVNQLKEYLHE